MSKFQLELITNSQYGRGTPRPYWNAALAQLPHAHVLQTAEWGEFKAYYGWTPTRFAWHDGEQIVAAASVLERRPRGLPFGGVLYVPKGPACAYTDRALTERVIADLENLARQRRAMFIKIDPDVTDPDFADYLQQRGWRYSADQIQFPNTILIDLTRPADEILAAMRSKTRYNIRLATRRGVTVHLGDGADLPRFYALYAETGERDGFLIRPFTYYQRAWRTFIDAGLAQLFLAEYEGQTLAGVIIFRFARRAWYTYGASAAQHRNLMPNHLLQWEAIKWAQARGCTIYDMWGAPTVMDESDPLWGVYRFKKGFNGAFTRHIGAYDYPVYPALYQLYGALKPKVLKWWRKLRPPS